MLANVSFKSLLGQALGLTTCISWAAANPRAIVYDDPAIVVLAPEQIIYQGTKAPSDDAKAKVVFRLGIRVNEVTTSVCTMTAIAKDILLTAAHCEQAGREHLLLSYDPVTGKARHIPISRIIKHPQYQFRKGPNGDESTHDIAIVKLGRPLAIKEFAHIPEANYRIPDETKVSIFGFGMMGRNPTEEELRQRPEVRALQEEMKKPGLTEQERRKLFARLLFVVAENPLQKAEAPAKIEPVKFAVTPVLLLQSENPLCGGDSGGPTFLKKAGKIIQVGVHSLSQNGSRCDKSSEEFLWGIIKGDHLKSWDTYVPFYSDWIKDEIKKLNAVREI